MKPNTIKIDEVEYIRADSVNQQAEKMNGLEYKIVRARSAGYSLVI